FHVMRMRATALETAGWVMASCSAARVMEPSRMIASKITSRLKSVFFTTTIICSDEADADNKLVPSSPPTQNRVPLSLFRGAGGCHAKSSNRMPAGRCRAGWYVPGGLHNPGQNRGDDSTARADGQRCAGAWSYAVHFAYIHR